ncbi:MAG: glycoside hydrolase family 3 C-terminal domain-containing protein [Bacteroidales bacterium]|nr:glycoside hydrolase family 3 C-terminal domain-containing protein [Bacteroidales bacterium]
MKHSGLILLATLIIVTCKNKTVQPEKPVFTPPVDYEIATMWADSIVNLMTIDEKISFIGGDRIFFTTAIPRLNIPAVMMTDATQGVHLREQFHQYKYEKVLPKSTAFPSPILLASTWNRSLARQYAQAIGEECKAGGIAILLGPGMNIYRISQCGRNFEYFGEDPFLASRMIENYVTGLQSTGTIATLKHFVANNSDFFRRKSNSVVDERTLHEIYTRAFKAGIDAGAMAVMTSYNPLNGEWCSQSSYVIDTLLRQDLGFKGLVMTDWWAVYDGEKVIKSGQDLEMPYRIATENAKQLLDSNKITGLHINRMVKSILTSLYAMQSFGRKPDTSLFSTFEKHEEIALQVAREGIVLLRNENQLLPLKAEIKNILLTGQFINHNAFGGGSGFVKGYNQLTLQSSLECEFGEKLVVDKNPGDEEIRSADAVILSIGTLDSEGWDRPFDLPDSTEHLVQRITGLNPNTIVVVNSGSGVNMSGWNTKAGAILFAWYGGQTGNKAVAEIISGKVNPSGKLPVTIEKDFKDSPGYGYVPEGEELYYDWNEHNEKLHPVFDIVYKEGIFIGYRWYDKKLIEPLYPFGFGLSYTTFSYSNLRTSAGSLRIGDPLAVSFTITNTGNVFGSETAQLYIHDQDSEYSRPVKELKGFEKISMGPGESKQIIIVLDAMDFSYWHPEQKDWYAEPGNFTVMIGSSSARIELSKEIELMK